MNLFSFLSTTFSIDPIENDVVHHEISISGKKIHYVEFGKGPLLVLIHGWNNDWSGFVPFMKQLDGFRIIAVDLPGYGGSDTLEVNHDVENMAKRLGKLFETINEFPEIVCCLSMGCVVGVEFANQHPQYLKRLVLIGPPIINYDWVRARVFRWYLKIVSSNGPMRKIAKKITGSQLYGHFTAKYINMHKYDAHLINKYGLRGRKKINPDALFQMGVSMYYYKLSRKLRDLSIPVLILMGTHDKLVDHKAAGLIDQEVNNVSVVWIGDSGHVVSLEQPSAAARHIQEFSSHM